MERLLSRWLGGARRSCARAPDGLRLYVIGDIHGRADLLERLLDSIDRHRSALDSSQSQLVFLGDYVDRGLQSRQVIDRLISLQQREPTTIFLKGNHDATLFDFLRNPAVLNTWRNYGGLETLESYGIRVLELLRQDETASGIRNRFVSIMPDSHRTFFADLEPYAIAGDYLFVHAGLRPGLPIEKQSDDDLLWIRDDFLSSRQNFGKIIVHGHTPSERPEIFSNRIGIDTGAYMTGVLTCLVLEADTRRFIQAKSNVHGKLSRLTDSSV